jgi:hypothetical protein
MKKNLNLILVLFLFILAIFYANHIFTTTNLFVPKQKELPHSKELFKELFLEITKFDRDSDTIYFSESDVLPCGNNGSIGLSKYERKMIKINYIKQNPYFIYIDRRTIDEVSFIDNKVIISGTIGGCPGSNNCFHSEATEFDINSKKGIIIYRQSHKILNKSTVEIVVTANSEEKMKLLMKYKKGKWTSKNYK